MLRQFRPNLWILITWSALNLLLITGLLVYASGLASAENQDGVAQQEEKVAERVEQQKQSEPAETAVPDEKVAEKEEPNEDPFEKSAERLQDDKVHLDYQKLAEPRVLGDPRAPVTMYEYSSFTCPHCASFHKGALSRIRENYIEDGEVKLVFVDFPLNQPSLVASAVARCVDNDKYFAFVQMLFDNQSVWAQDFKPRNLRQFSKLVGMSDAVFEACSTDKNLQRLILTRAQQATSKYDIRSTPSFIFNDNERRIQGARPYEEFRSVLRDLLHP